MTGQPQMMHWAQAIQPQMTGGYQAAQPQITGGHQAIQPQMTTGSIGYSHPTPQHQATFASPTPQQFYSSTPLAVLGQGSSPADCPMCRHRTMTLVNTEVGNTTQYVRYGFYGPYLDI